jgi:[ribosomal protein S5]-alanine N-acetyltransferase
MTEALGRLLSFCFNELSLNRIESRHTICNPASGKVMQKCGMKFEGTLRENILSKGIYHDCNIYSILKRDLK